MEYLSLWLGGVSRLMLTVLAGDLLYLYYIGSWYDPIKLIEISEVVLLYICVIGGIVWTIKYLKNPSKKKHIFVG